MTSLAPTLIPFGNDTRQYKDTHHHYCGFFSLTLLACIVDDTVVIDGKQYPVSDETAIDWAFDGEDTIVTEKRLLYTERALRLHTPIFNVHNELVGLVLRGYITNDSDHCYAIQDGFKLYNNHLSGMNLVVREKRKPIAYADQQFDTKAELCVYLRAPKHPNPTSAILYHSARKNAQLMLYRDGVQFSNSQLRKNVFGPL
jgi:hypothetical protein